MTTSNRRRFGLPVTLTNSPARRRGRALLAVPALAAVAALALSSCASPTTVDGQAVASSPSGSGTSSTSPSGTSTTSSPPAKPKHTVKVHISLINADNSTYGVGMPIIAYFSKKIRNAKALQDATTVKVNGKLAHGAWYFEPSDAGHGPIEGHFRLSTYWPAHSHVFVDIPARGLSAGGNMVYSDSLTSSWDTGAKTISVVNQSTHQMTVTTDGKHFGTFPISLGTATTPTKSGIKVIMEQLPSICMTDTAHSYYECGIKWDQRLTYDGEYLHAAPWNGSLGQADLSNGCTNLSTTDAEKVFNLMHVGDVVDYPSTDGPKMTLGEGYGDWNVSWSLWRTGGAVSTS